MQTTVDTDPSFYGDDACGTFFEVDGAMYGPDSVPAGPSFGGLTPVSQATTGAGTGEDPYVITTVVDIGTTGITATETDTWIGGASSFTTSVALDNTSGTAHSIHVYRAGDCYFADTDYSFGEVAGLAGLPAGAVACHAAAYPSASTPVPGNRMMEWVPQTPGNTYVEDYYATMWQGVGTGGDLPDRVNARVLLVQGNDLRRPMAAGELFGSKSPRPLNSVNLYPLLQQLPPGSIYWPLRGRAWPRKLYEFSSSPTPRVVGYADETAFQPHPCGAYNRPMAPLCRPHGARKPHLENDRWMEISGNHICP